MSEKKKKVQKGNWLLSSGPRTAAHEKHTHTQPSICIPAVRACAPPPRILQAEPRELKGLRVLNVVHKVRKYHPAKLRLTGMKINAGEARQLATCISSFIRLFGLTRKWSSEQQQQRTVSRREPETEIAGYKKNRFKYYRPENMVGGAGRFTTQMFLVIV